MRSTVRSSYYVNIFAFDGRFEDGEGNCNSENLPPITWFTLLLNLSASVCLLEICLPTRQSSLQFGHLAKSETRTSRVLSHRIPLTCSKNN